MTADAAVLILAPDLQQLILDHLDDPNLDEREECLIVARHVVANGACGVLGVYLDRRPDVPLPEVVKIACDWYTNDTAAFVAREAFPPHLAEMLTNAVASGMNDFAAATWAVHRLNAVRGMAAEAFKNAVRARLHATDN